MGLRKFSILIGCLLAAFIIVTILSVAIKPVIAASSSLPEGALLGSELRFRNPFFGGMGGMGGYFGGPWADMDDMDLGYGGMMGSFGQMNPWMMHEMDQFEHT